jgi:hypothetical protein
LRRIPALVDAPREPFANGLPTLTEGRSATSNPAVASEGPADMASGASMGSCPTSVAAPIANHITYRVVR